MQPFYGGKKHKITSEIFSPSKKVILTINGEWNGVMISKDSSGKQEVFVDTRTIPITKKKVESIADQEPFESRRLWKDVTRALKMQNTELATTEKFKIEQSQREQVKERQNSGQKWRTRVCLILIYK